MTIENAIVTGALRVVGDLNGSVINATTFNGNLNGNATSADKLNRWLKIQLNGTDAAQYDGTGNNKTVNVTAAAIGALANTTLYAGSATQGGPATSAVKLTAGAGDATHPIYIAADGIPTVVSGTQAINVASADKVNHSLRIDLDGTTAVTYDGDVENKTVDITPESINAVRRNGDTIPGPLTLNGAFTVNNDAYIDSATVGDLLVNGGTRFVGDINAGKITASSFVGPLTGNATSADKVNHYISIQINGTEKAHYDGSTNQSVNLTAESLGLLGNTTKYALGDAVGGNAVAANKLTVNAGSSTRPVYFSAGVPVAISNTDEIDLIAKKANSLKEELIFLVKDTEKWRYNGSTQRELNLSPALIDAFDIVEGSTVSGEAVFNNVVYLNDEAYADSMTIENAIVTGALRVVGDLNGSVINATTFNGNLNGNATSADKVNHWLKIQFDGTDKAQYDGSGDNKTVNITPAAIGALSTTTKYAASASVGGSATSAEKLNTNAGDATHPIYFANGVPVQVSGTQAINVASADKVNHSLRVDLDGTTAVTYDGNTENKSVDITPEAINALRNTTKYAGSSSVGGAATSANKLNTNAGDATHPVYFANGVPVQVSGTQAINVASADKLNHYVSISADGTEKIHFDGQNNDSFDITPEIINAVRRNGDTIPGPLTLNGVFTVNNDAYIDSATIGDLLVNGGTRFVGDVNAGKITASSFVGPLTGNATSADKVNHYVSIQINGTEKVHYDGSANQSVNLTPDSLGLLGATTKYALGDAVGGNAVKANALNVSAAIGSTTRPVYIPATGVPAVISNTTEIDLIAKKANSLKESYIYSLRGTEQWRYDGSTQRTLDITPNDMGIFDTLEGSTVQGESVFNNVVYLNDETYADSMTIENAIVTGALRVVGDLNGSVINATTFNGTLNGNATSANKVNQTLTIELNGTAQPSYDGSIARRIEITPAAIGALASNANYAAGASSNGPAVSANKLNTNAGSTTLPVYFSNGVPAAVSTTSTIDIVAKQANKTTYNLAIAFDGTNAVTFDGSTQNKSIDITPEAINAVRRNGDTIPGPLTLNGVFTVNNDAYIDSATVGDLLVNGGTRFVGDVNAGKITASSFVGPLTGNATSADKVNHYVSIQVNGTEKVHFDGSANQSVNLTPDLLGLLGSNTKYALGDAVGGNAVAANSIRVPDTRSAVINPSSLKATNGVTFDFKSNTVTGLSAAYSGVMSLRPYAANSDWSGGPAHQLAFDADGLHWRKSTGDTTWSSWVDVITSDKHKTLTYSLRGTSQWLFNGDENRTLDITPNDMGIFDTLLGSTVQGESVFNNVVYLNDETYADSMTIENAIVTGALRVVGDLNGSVINATTFNGNLNGNATSADKVNKALTIELNGTAQPTYDGSIARTITISPSTIGALASNANYAAGASSNGPAVSANKLNTNAGSDILPVYFSNGVPVAVSTSKEVNILAKQANKTTYSLSIATDGTEKVVFNGGTQNKSIDITPELINAVRRNGDTIPGPLTLNGVFTVNNDAYIDSATIGDLLVNGGTRFVGDVNAGKITASSFVGPLTGNASTADKVNHTLAIEFNGTNQCSFTGAANATVNITPTAIHAVDDRGDTMTGTLQIDNVNGIKINSHDTDLKIWEVVGNSGSWDSKFGFYDLYRGSQSGNNNTLELYADNQSGTHVKVRTITQDGKVTWHTDQTFANTIIGNIQSANKVNNKLRFDLRGTNVWEYDGSALKTLDLTPNDLGIFDTLLGSTVQGESVFNNVVYLNDETYADSMTIENAIVTGALRVVGDLNGSVINATTFNGALNGNASTADKVNHALNLEFDGDALDPFDGSAVRTFDITPEAINAVRRNGDTIPGPLTLNGVMTINNDAYIDSATIGDLLVNGGTRFVGDVNAGKITASSFVGPLTGNATSADKVNHSLAIEFNGTNKATFDGSGPSNQTVNITPAAIAAAPKVNGVYYGTCDTAQATQAKVVTLVNGTGFELVNGAMIAVKFTNASAGATMTLQVGSTAAKNLYQYGTSTMSSSQHQNGWPAGALVLFVYDATANSNAGGWFRTFWDNYSYAVNSVYVTTAAGTAAKVSSNSSGYILKPGNIFELTLSNTNTAASALTLNILNTGAKPIWINGHPSSATNYDLPAGKYIVYYDDDKYLFTTKGKIPGQDYIHDIYVGSTTGGTSGQYSYFRFAAFTATTGTNPVAGSVVYRATYRFKGVNPFQLGANYTFWSQVTVSTNSSGTTSFSAINNWIGTQPYYNYIYSAPTGDNPGLFFGSYGTNHYTAEIELVSVEKVISTSELEPLNVAVITDEAQGYTIDFLLLNDVRTSTSHSGSITTFSSYSQSYYSNYAYNVYQYHAGANTTTKYFLSGAGQSASTTTYGSLYSSQYYNSNIYFLNQELYAPLHVNKFYGTADVSYGTTLPSSPTTGQLFFQVDGSGEGSSITLSSSKTSGNAYVTGYDGSDNSKLYYKTGVYIDCANSVLRGAAWNDYAEFRKDNGDEKYTQVPGRCVKENGDGSLSLTTKRLERGCEIISDTFGMAIGQDADHNVPIAVSGRVLAYTFEERDIYTAYIGYPVCSGPNGTVSIMTEEEEEKYPSRIIGTVSEVPTYETWGNNNQVKVDGRVWIRIR